jgi:hypothetical protein
MTMKARRLRRLQLGTLVALVLYVTLVIYLFLTMPVGQPRWNNVFVEHRIATATTVQELQNDLRSAVSNLSAFRHSRNEMLLVCFVASIGMTGFLGWSLFSIRGIKREVSDHNTV